MHPTLSVIVIGYRMAAQLVNTLFTLSPDYQRGVDASDFEVVVVENESDRCLDAEVVARLPENMRYFRRRETGHSPVAAINFGFAQCRGDYIGLLVDGARMLSPRVLEYARLAWRMDPDSITSVPGYHIGRQEHHTIGSESEAYASEQRALASIDWRGNGYLLFTIATIGGGNRNGYLQPFMESNCLFASRRHFERIGFADERFQLPGGGSINLHMFRALGMHPDTRLVVLPGEGSFHQYHGGVTTRSREDRAAELLSHKQQLHGIWNGEFHSLRREPTLLGSVTPWALPVLEHSARMGVVRHERLVGLGRALWEDDQLLSEREYFNPTDAAARRTPEDPAA